LLVVIPEEGPMDATRLLKEQHAEVRALFGRYEKATDTNERQDLFDKIADALAAHCTIEEKIFYPSVYIGDFKDELEKAVEEHLAAKRVLSDLLAMGPDDEQFDAKMSVLQEEIDHHVKEEEGKLFPKVEKKFPAHDLEAMGDEMQAMFEELCQENPRDAVPGETDEAAPLR
jgi:hemerythrin superfamily protein